MLSQSHVGLMRKLAPLYTTTAAPDGLHHLDSSQCTIIGYYWALVKYDAIAKLDEFVSATPQTIVLCPINAYTSSRN
eukprot:m.57161 g.57161  ORF g.57161 m.57161 type:complete len:77 (+) comp11588_c0_seq3:1136-1366(+)